MSFRIFPGTPGRRCRCVPRVECLEDRALLTVTSSGVIGGVLTLTGDNGANTILLQDDATGLTITRDGVGQHQPLRRRLARWRTADAG